MLFARDTARRKRERIVRDLYERIVAQARQPALYTGFEIPDTVDGRFDLIVLHAFLTMRRLGLEKGPRTEEARAVSQALFDLMFADFDQSLREMGVSDLSVGRKVKQMAEAFYGRVAAYDAALADPAADAADAVLCQALQRNLYRGATVAAATGVAAYMRRQAAQLDGQGIDAILDGRIAFAALEPAA